MQVLAHPDPFVLEEELLARVGDSKQASPFARILVIVPTGRLAAHVRRRIAARLGACLGVEVLHHRALARRILDAAVVDPPPRIASEPLLETLLAKVLATLPENLWSRFVAERPTAQSALLGSLSDLREAGISSDAARAELRGERERDLAEIYAAYVDALVRVRGRGFVDGAGLLAEATAHAADHASGFVAIVHHGAYELIGVHLDLVKALDRGREVTFLLPCEPGASAFRLAEHYARRHLLGAGEIVQRIPDRPGGLLGGRIAALYEEGRRPEPLPPGRVSFRTSQGASAEVTAAIRSAIASTAETAEPSEIAIIARSLTPYAAAIEAAFDEEPRLPWASSLGVPLRRDPAVRDLLGLLRIVADDFPRALTAELLRSPRISWGAMLFEPFRGDLAEPFSRRAGIVGGLEEWTRRVPEWAGKPVSGDDDSEEERAEEEARAKVRRFQAERIARALENLADRAGRGKAKSWRQHAETVRKMARTLVADVPSDPSSPLRSLFALADGMEDLPAILEEDRTVPFREMVDWLERAAISQTLRKHDPDAGGIRVLDAMQARGMTFRRVALLGFHAGLVPLVPREDPFLPDSARSRLREATGRPLELNSEGDAEERILLAMLLGSAKDRIEVSWQRADEAGRSKAPSLALREVSRLVLGRPDLEATVNGAHRLPSHPASAMEDLLESTGILSPSDEMMLLAFRGDDDRVEEALLARDDDLEAGLAMLRATESFSRAESRFDARVGPFPGLEGPLSVSAIERLGNCPLQFFFRHHLRVREIQEEAGLFDLSVKDWGDRVHRLLELLYRRLDTEGWFAPGREGELVKRGEELLDWAWQEALADVSDRLDRRFPTLWAIECERWKRALLAFLREDLAGIPRSEARGFEESRVRRLDFGDGIEAEVLGRLDRVFESGARSSIGDYKTVGKLKRRGDVTLMLKGKSLQAPLYWLLGAEGSVEIFGVGPDHDPANGAEEEQRRVKFEGFGSAEEHEGFKETMRELLRLAGSGTFPLHRDFHCNWCEYRRACRRDHPPTLFREEVWEDAAAFRDLQRKNRKYAPTLAAVRARNGAQEAEEEPE